MAIGQDAYSGKAKAFRRTMADLKRPGIYFWKVIAEDGNGGTTESETRRFELK